MLVSSRLPLTIHSRRRFKLDKSVRRGENTHGGFDEYREASRLVDHGEAAADSITEPLNEHQQTPSRDSMRLEM
jgi:hypothetical protein